MYEDWVVERWETPVSDARALYLILLADWQSRLTIVVEEVRNGESHYVTFTFAAYVAYRNIFEEYRLALWAHLDLHALRCGSTMIVSYAPWSDMFGEEPLIGAHNQTLQHYLVCTLDDVIEVWANTPPTIVAIDCGGADAADMSTTLLGQVLRER